MGIKSDIALSQVQQKYVFPLIESYLDGQDIKPHLLRLVRNVSEDFPSQDIKRKMSHLVTQLHLKDD